MSYRLSVSKPEKLHVRPPAAGPCGAKARGFTLIEVLVTIIVLTLGLLGLAGLQATSLKNNQVSYYRGIASQQAYDIADRMRANQIGVNGGNYDDLSATVPSDPPADPGCFTSGCDATGMALTDLFQWLAVTAAVLPAGTGRVQCAVGPTAPCAVVAAGANRVFDITVTWTEKCEVPPGGAPNLNCNQQGNITQNFVTRFTP